jgi:dihydrofolate reductase
VPTRIVYYAAMSLDGRIAGEDHDLSFLQTLERGPEDDYTSFYDSLDSLLMGAGTWDFMVGHGSWPYADKPCWVVTHRDSLAPLEAPSTRRTPATSASSCGGSATAATSGRGSSAAAISPASCSRPTCSTS